MINFKEFILGRFSILISYASHVKYCIGFGLSFTSKGVEHYKGKVYEAFEINLSLSLLVKTVSIWLVFRKNKDITYKCDILCCEELKQDD